MRRGLIFGLVRLRSHKFICIRIGTEMQVADVSVIRRIVFQTSENRKVGGGSTALLATASHCHGAESLCVLDCGDDL